ncbi:hypothetical protein CHUAL_012102 [Chamberlinius hualienensis]
MKYDVPAAFFVLGSFLIGFIDCQTATDNPPATEAVTSTEKTLATEAVTDAPTTTTELPATFMENLTSGKLELPSRLKPATEELKKIRGVYPYFGKLQSSLQIKNDSLSCILLQLDASISFTQEGQQSKEMTEVPMDELIGYSGDCGDGKQKPQTVSLWFYHQGIFTLQFTFQKNETGKFWLVKSIELSNAETSKLIGTSKQREIIIAAPVNKSFSCPFVFPIQMYDDRGNVRAYVILETITMQAYSESNKFGPESMCPYRSDTTPIAVGCTLAVITILIGAGYAIYRSFFVKKVDYDTMED